MAGEEKAAQEVVIVRRRGGGEDEAHHGGVWKIAYADFMTAMMAFFLVMWLVNASNKKTLTQVATYFNPIRMSDRVTNPKGLHDMPDEGPQEMEGKEYGKERASEKPGEGEESDHEPKKTGEPAGHAPTEEGIFRDPYGLLAALAAEANQKAADDSASSAQSAAVPAAPAAGGEAFRDPFDPSFRTADVPDHPDGDTALETAYRILNPSAVPGDSTQDAAAVAEKGAASVATGEQPVVGEDGAAESAEAADGSEAASAAPAMPPAVAASNIDVLRLQSEVNKIVDGATGKVPNVEVAATPEGILISLTDEFDFGMFDVASAKPRPELVVVMQKIGTILKDRPGKVVVRGHTDARRFKSDLYDNWRLSTARAHMAYHMLLRGGIADTRFERVEGYADRSLKLPGDPQAARNRRIEILLRSGAKS